MGRGRGIGRAGGRGVPLEAGRNYHPRFIRGLLGDNRRGLGQAEDVRRLVGGGGKQTREHVQTFDEEQGGADKRLRGRGTREQGDKGTKG